MEIVNYSEARDNLKSLLDKVVADREPAVIFRRRGESVVVMAKSDYDSMVETNYLLSNPANARRLRESIARMDGGHGEEHDLIEP